MSPETLTKQIATRLRLKKQIDSALPFAGEEYGDYEKFEDGKNQIKETNERGLDDFGLDTFEKNYKDMLK